MVFTGLFPIDNTVREPAMHLISCTLTIHHSRGRQRLVALGFGFRVGFWALSMEVVKERLEREFDLT